MTASRDSTVQIGLNSAPAPTSRVLTVEDVMTRSVVSVRSTERLRAAIEILLMHGVGGAPVELGGALLGTVTLMDLNRALVARPAPRTFRRSARSLASGTVADVMDMDIVTAPVSTPLADVVEIMDRRPTDRVLVADNAKIVGIVTAADVARGLALFDVEARAPLDS